MGNQQRHKRSGSEGSCVDHSGATRQPVEFDAPTGRIDADELDQLRAICTDGRRVDREHQGVDDRDFEAPTTQIPRLPPIDGDKHGVMEGLLTLPKRSPALIDAGTGGTAAQVWKSAVKPKAASDSSATTNDECAIEYFDPDDIFSEWEQEYSSEPSVGFEIVVAAPMTKERLAELEGDRGVSITEVPDDFFE